MTGRHLAVALTLGLFATWASADNAVRRDGGSSGGSSGGAAANQPSVHSSSSGSSSGSSGGSTYAPSHSSASGLSPAQRRQPRPGTGTGHRPGRYYPGSYYYPYYSPYYGGYGYYGSVAWWPYGGYYGGYYPYGGTVYRYGYSDRGDVRLLVDPAETRVYVDGYYAGVVDDFDGLFQRLHVSPGRHEIALKLEGYQTHRVKVYVGSGSTLKVHYDMQKGTGETVEDLAGDVDDRYARRNDRYRRDDDRDRDARDERIDDDRPSVQDDRAPASEPGRMRLTVRPEDASVYVDGQFRGSGRQVSGLELSPGRHRLEVVRPGFRTEERDVEIQPGHTRDVDVELQRP